MCLSKLLPAFLVALTLTTAAQAQYLTPGGHPAPGSLDSNSRQLPQGFGNASGHWYNTHGLVIGNGQGGTYVIDLRRAGANGLGDPFLILTDTQFRVIKTDDDSGGNLNARMSVYLNPGTYYLIASSYRSNDAGQYELSVSGRIFANGGPAGEIELLGVQHGTGAQRPDPTGGILMPNTRWIGSGNISGREINLRFDFSRNREVVIVDGGQTFAGSYTQEGYRIRVRTPSLGVTFDGLIQQQNGTRAWVGQGRFDDGRTFNFRTVLSDNAVSR